MINEIRPFRRLNPSREDCCDGLLILTGTGLLHNNTVCLRVEFLSVSVYQVGNSLSAELRGEGGGEPNHQETEGETVNY